jgi:hypothetical protein
VITGARTAAHVEGAVAGSEIAPLDDDELRAAEAFAERGFATE